MYQVLLMNLQWMGTIGVALTRPETAVPVPMALPWMLDRDLDTLQMDDNDRWIDENIKKKKKEHDVHGRRNEKEPE